MQIEHDSWMSLVPEGHPPAELLPPEALALAANLEDQPILLRSYLWATAVIHAGFRSRIPLPPRFVHFSAGFIALPGDDNDSPGRGAKASAPRFAFGGHVVIRSRRERLEFRALDVGQITVPVVVVHGNFELHGCPPHPSGGSATCWAESSSAGSPWQKGILTCRHIVARQQIGSNVSLTPSTSHSTPASATLADIDECTIDAAVLAVGSSDWPTGLSPMLIRTPAVPGLSVKFEGRNLKSQVGTVLRVFHYGTYAGTLFGQRVVADCHGSPGDSGALLQEMPGTAGVGIYMGTIPDGVGGRDGIFQDLSQAVSFYGLDLYQ